MKRLSLLTLIFAVLSLFFFLLLIFLRIPFPPYPLASWQDTIDILTPLVLIPIYWMMFKGITNGESSLVEEISFMVMAAFWAGGQGMHLSANSINNLIDSLLKKQVVDVSGTDIFTLTNFFDEYLSHYLWHIGVLGMMALMIFASLRSSSKGKTHWGLATLSGVIYGFTCFCIFLEGQTLPIGLPFTIIAVVVILIWGRNKLTKQPVLAFLFLSCLIALLLLAGWGFYWGYFPEFSEVGLI